MVAMTGISDPTSMREYTVQLGLVHDVVETIGRL
jgi:hypothetical protein